MHATQIFGLCLLPALAAAAALERRVPSNIKVTYYKDKNFSGEGFPQSVPLDATCVPLKDGFAGNIKSVNIDLTESTFLDNLECWLFTTSDCKNEAGYSPKDGQDKDLTDGDGKFAKATHVVCGDNIAN